MAGDTCRIGCASGFWGDSLEGARQLVTRGDIDVLVFDYLAEITMSLLARIKARKPDAGYVPDFIASLEPVLGEIAKRRIKVVSNAGGMNPRACAKALAAAAQKAGVDLVIATIDGDDLMPSLDDIRASGAGTEMFTGAPLPARLLSINAYLGAKPIAAALAAGADVVITGRCVDSAVTLGALVHCFGWSWTDWDRLSQASLAGHLLECSTQVTGGISTDWRDVPGWDDMGYPIAECAADGSFVVTKPAGTGGRITPLTVGEQLLYEIGDPASYILPDVVCDWRHVTLEQQGEDRVLVRNARGRPATRDLKVSATYADGYRAIGTMTLAGRDAAKKAARAADAILARACRLNAERGRADFSETSVEILGAEATYGEHAHTHAASAREVVLKLGVRHADEAAVELFAREVIPAASSMAQGLTGFFAGRPSVQPVVRLHSVLWPKSKVTPSVHIAEREIAVPFDTPPAAEPAAPLPAPSPAPRHDIATETVPLIALAVGRSGDKGDIANIGIIARRPEYLPYLRAGLTADAVHAVFAHTGTTKVERFELPGFHAFNFVLHDALGGGGIASLRIDPQGKAFAQMLMDLPIPVPAEIAATARAAMKDETA